MKKCISCYHFTRGYCSYHDRDVSKDNGCNKHVTINETKNYET